MRSSIPAPVVVDVFCEPAVQFLAVVAGDELDLTDHLPNLCLLGFVFGPPKDAGLLTASGVYGEPTGPTSPGTVRLTGPAHGVVTTANKDPQHLDTDNVLALAGLGLLHTLNDAYAFTEDDIDIIPTHDTDPPACAPLPKQPGS